MNTEALMSLVSSIDGWETKTNNEILLELNSQVVVEEVHELQSYAGVQMAIGMEATATMKITLERTLKHLENALLAEGIDEQTAVEINRQIAFLNMLHWGLLSTKVDFAEPNVRSALTTFRPLLESLGIPVSSLLEIGVKTKSRYAAAGGVGLATIQQVNAAVSELNKKAEVAKIIKDANKTYNAFIDYVSESYDGTGDKPRLVSFNVPG